MSDNGDPPQPQQQQGKLPLPVFSAEGTSASAISMNAEQFLSRFDDWATVCGYADQRKAKALGYALSKAAATWFQQTSRRGRIDMEDWSAVETAFRARFIKAISPRYIAAEIAKLSQKPKESVADFLDRCELAQTLLDEQWAVARAATHRESRLEVVESVHQSMVLHHFLRHLRPEIGDKLAFCQNLTTLDEHVKAAERIEKAGTDKSFAAAAASGASIASIQEEPIAALQGGAGPSQPKQKKKRQPPPSYTCRLCGIKGHFINDCPRSDKQLRKQGRTGFQQQPAQQQRPAGQFHQPQPPRHLGAIPKASQWQRPQQQAAAIGVSGGAFSPAPQMMYQQQQFQPPMGGSLYPQLPAQDFPDTHMSNMGAQQTFMAPPTSPDWPMPNSGFHQ